MRIHSRSLLRATVSLACAAATVGAGTAATTDAAAAAPQALAFVANGQVQVFEAGQLTTAGQGQSPAWSPNGASLLYMHADFARVTADIFVTDTHGANTRRVVTGAYPYLNPSWSHDSNYVVYAAVQGSAKATGTSLPLAIRAVNVANGQSRTLASFTLNGGCTTYGSALQVAAATAEGAYRGTPSTLIWAQPNLVVVSSSCTGSGLAVLQVGAKPGALAGWSGATLSPDGTTIAGVVHSAGSSAQGHIGLLKVAGAKASILKATVNATAVAWATDGKTVYAIVEPSDPMHGSATVDKIAVSGGTVTRLGTIPCAGAYHPSVDSTGKSLALAVITSAPAKASAVPTITINLLPTATSAPARAFFIGSQPAWRP